MERYIDADKLSQRIKASPAFRNLESYWYESKLLQNVVLDLIDNTPTADVEEVKHGEWIVDKVHNIRKVRSTNLAKQMCYKCSLCGRKSGNNRHLNYCPRCGAKMDGGVMSDECKRLASKSTNN